MKMGMVMGGVYNPFRGLFICILLLMNRLTNICTESALIKSIGLKL